jgi:hypothetical protein
MNRQIIAYSKAELKPEGQFRHSESDRSQDSRSPEISQKERSPEKAILKSSQSGLTVPCSSCGSIEVRFKPSETSHHGSWHCSQCEAFRGWVRKPENVARVEQENQLIDKLLERSDGLTSWERLFLKSVKETRKRSPKQRQKLNLIASRLGVSHHE